LSEVSNDNRAGRRAARPCPICGKPAAEKFRPFCSTRCANVDLSRWLAGAYAIPAEPDDDEAGRPEDRQRESDR
jgi:endogenous inhibitor of DNA gyrase (YacG/DUF329 family)